MFLPVWQRYNSSGLLSSVSYWSARWCEEILSRPQHREQIFSSYPQSRFACLIKNMLLCFFCVFFFIYFYTLINYGVICVLDTCGFKTITTDQLKQIDQARRTLNHLRPVYTKFCFPPFFFTEPTKITVPPLSMDATVGESIVLPCEVSKDSTLHPSFKWFFNGKLIDFSRHDHFGMIGGVRFCIFFILYIFQCRIELALQTSIPISASKLWTWAQGHLAALWTYRHKSVWLQDLRLAPFNTRRTSNSCPQDPSLSLCTSPI